MITSGLFIARSEFEAWPSALQKEVLDRLFANAKVGSVHSSDGASPETMGPKEGSSFEDEHFAELSPGQAREFYNGCGAKIKKAIDTIASSKSRFFQVADVASSVNVGATELRGVWAGLTRRTQTITGDKDAYLINWSGDAINDDEGNYVDQRGEMAEMTFRSFRKALRLD